MGGLFSGGLIYLFIFLFFIFLVGWGRGAYDQNFMVCLTNTSYMYEENLKLKEFTHLRVCVSGEGGEGTKSIGEPNPLGKVGSRYQIHGED